MSESRDNYAKTQIRLKLINALRGQAMTRKAIRDFLSAEYIRHGKTSSKCKNILDYKVSDKTVKREIEYLEKNYGDQLDDKYGGIPHTYKLDLYDFPDTVIDTEIQALDVAIQKMKNNLNEQTLLKNLKNKLTAKLYKKIENTNTAWAANKKINEIEQKISADFAFVGPHPIIDFDANIKSVLDEAIHNQHQISFKYKSKEHTVCPLGIMYGPSNVYLIAYVCKDEKIYKNPIHYIISDIKNIVDTQRWFDKGSDFSIEEYANSMFGIYNDGTMYDIEWLIKDKETIKIAKKYQFHPKQQNIPNPDGTLTIKMRTGGLRAISIYLTQWGGNIIPIKPKELITEYQKLLTNCLDSIKK